jgi:hypothetical protein
MGPVRLQKNKIYDVLAPAKDITVQIFEININVAVPENVTKLPGPVNINTNIRQRPYKRNQL